MRQAKAVNNLGIFGCSPPFRRLLKAARLAGKAPAPVLIAGESGSGKETAARLIHESSGRKGPFVTVNCGTLPAQLVEAELFGYVRGAFTGAQSAGKRGLLELAHGGTIFLDEVAELDPRCQAALLRFCDSGQVRRLGATRDVVVDVRIISATNRNLKAIAEEGVFRHDLYFRLAKQEIEVPPLKSRGADVLMIARYQLRLASTEYGRTVRLGHEAARALVAHDWPGNVRELEQVMRTLARDGRRRVTADDMLKAIGVPASDATLDLHDRLLALIDDAGIIQAHLLIKELGLPKSTVWRHLRQLINEGCIAACREGRRVLVLKHGFARRPVGMIDQQHADEAGERSEDSDSGRPVLRTRASKQAREDRVMTFILQHPDLSPSDLAKHLGESPVNIKRALGSLVSQGRLRAYGTTQDRRYSPAASTTIGHISSTSGAESGKGSSSFGQDDQVEAAQPAGERKGPRVVYEGGESVYFAVRSAVVEHATSEPISHDAPRSVPGRSAGTRRSGLENSIEEQTERMAAALQQGGTDRAPQPRPSVGPCG